MATSTRRRRTPTAPVKKTDMELQVERTARYREKQKEKNDMRQVMVWVPSDKRDQLIAYAARLRKQAAV